MYYLYYLYHLPSYFPIVSEHLNKFFWPSSVLSKKDLTHLRVVFLDQVDDPGPKNEDYPRLKGLEGKWMANLGCLFSMDRELGTNIRDDVKPKQLWS